MPGKDTFIGQIIDQFRILRHLGRGGMADVYLAHDMQLERQVVLKILLPHIVESEEFSARFQREARATARLQHPHIVQVYSIGHVPDGRAYIAMQYISGGALSDYLHNLIAQDQWITPTYALVLMRQIAEALAAAHAAGIVHRDLKPGNILLREDGTAVLSDLGIAVVQQATTRLTRTGGIIGTPHYMSPEQAAGHAVDGRSDIYSLGIILYELLYGRPPFVADSPLAIVHHQLYEQPAPLEQRRPGLAAATYRVVKTCLHKDPNARYQSAAELMAALDEALRAEGSTAVAPTIVDMPAYATTEQLSIPYTYTPAPEPKTTTPRRFVLWGVVPLILLALLFFVWRTFLVTPMTAPDNSISEVTPGNTIEPTTLPTETAVLTSTPKNTEPPPFAADAITNVGANIRSGPWLTYEAIPGGIDPGTEMQLIGRNADASWLNILLPNNETGWIFTTLVSINPNIDINSLTITELAAAPTAIPATTATSGIQTLPGSGVIRMTQNAGSEQYAPILSPDQQTLTFMSDLSGDWRVYTMNTAGGGWQEAIPNTPSYHGHFSPDGRTLILAAKQNENWDIYTVPVGGGSPTRLTSRSGDEVYPSYSPDGEWIVYMSNQGNGWDVYRMRADGSDDQAVLNSAAEETFPVFAPDGRSILFQSNQDGGHNIYTIPAAGGTPQQLTFSSIRDANPVYSPDGEWIAFESDRDGNYEIYLMRADGSDLYNATNHTARDQLPAFSPDGRWLLFQSDRDGNTEIYRQSITLSQ